MTYIIPTYYYIEDRQAQKKYKKSSDDFWKRNYQRKISDLINDVA